MRRGKSERSELGLHSNSSAGFARAIVLGEVSEGASAAPSERSGLGEHIVVVYGRDA
jgi:hypothetical protein